MHEDTVESLRSKLNLEIMAHERTKIGYALAAGIQEEELRALRRKVIFQKARIDTLEVELEAARFVYARNDNEE